MRYLTLLLLLAIAPALCAQNLFTELDARLKTLAADGHLSGNLLLAEGDEILLSASYGYSDFTNKTPLTENSLFELASVSKQFTAAAVSLLMADGKLDADAPVSSYLPELKGYPTVTTRQLVHHTAGLPDYMGFEEVEVPDDTILDNQFVLDYLRDQQPEAEFTAGEEWAYSNTGYVILASLVERVSGQTFGAFLEQRIFRPLGMKNARIYRRRFAPENVANFAPGYVWDKERYVIPDSLEDLSFVRQLDGMQGDGMVNATLTDLYRWDRALANGELLDTSLLFKPGNTTTDEDTGYAFGWGVKTHKDYGRMISHSGGWPGVATFLYRFPDTDRLLILLRNDDGGHDGNIKVLRNALRTLHGLPLEEESLVPTVTQPVDTARIADYLGVYAIEPTFKLTFFRDGDSLMGQATGQSAIQLLALAAADRFSLVGVEAEIQFLRNKVGEVTSLTLFQGGQEVPAAREE